MGFSAKTTWERELQLGFSWPLGRERPAKEGRANRSQLMSLRANPGSSSAGSLRAPERSAAMDMPPNRADI